MSEMFKNTCKLLKIEKIQTTAYYPEKNEALERSHQTLAEYFRHYITTIKLTGMNGSLMPCSLTIPLPGLYLSS